MKLHKKILTIVSLLSITLTGCISTKQTNTPVDEYKVHIIKNEIDNQKIEEPAKDSVPEPVVQTATLTAIGDMLIHSTVWKDAQKNNGYDFTPMLERVKPYLENSDITFANQETVIGGTQLGLKSYPTFNSPYEVGDALKSVGVDIVSMANNHTLDSREVAIQNAIEHWNQIGMEYTGSYKDNMDAQKIRVIEKNGIKFSFLAFTYGTNGIPVPEGKDYLVNLIDKDKIKQDIQKAKEVSDVVVLSLHFGTEYQRLPNDVQKELAQFSVNEGANIILGTHPHVLQPSEWLTDNNGNKAFVIYSLGNFLSAQDQLYQQIGGILKLKVEKITEGENSKVSIKEPQFIPTYVSFHNWRDYQVIPMYQLHNNQLTNAQQRYQEIKTHMSQFMPEVTFIEQ